MSDVLTTEVVEGVRGHMNSEHTDDALRIVRGIGGLPGADAATLADLTADGAVFEVSAKGEQVHVTVPWGRPIEERADIRHDIVRMHTEACDALGIEPPAH